MIIKISERLKEILTDCLRSEDKVDQDKEHFWVFHLDCRNRIKLLELVSLGTLNSSLVHPQEVFTRAVGENGQLKSSLLPTITRQVKQIRRMMILALRNVWLRRVRY